MCASWMTIERVRAFEAHREEQRYLERYDPAAGKGHAPPENCVTLKDVRRLLLTKLRKKHFTVFILGRKSFWTLKQKNDITEAISILERSKLPFVVHYVENFLLGSYLHWCHVVAEASQRLGVRSDTILSVFLNREFFGGLGHLRKNEKNGFENIRGRWGDIDLHAVFSQVTKSDRGKSENGNSLPNFATRTVSAVYPCSGVMVMPLAGALRSLKTLEALSNSAKTTGEGGGETRKDGTETVWTECTDSEEGSEGADAAEALAGTLSGLDKQEPRFVQVPVQQITVNH